MLSTVLLHMVKAARPVDSAVDFARRDRRVQNVSHPLFFVNHLNHVGPAQRPGIERLAARGRVKRGPVQVNSPPVVRGFDDVRAKLPQVTVLVVKAFRHGAGEVISTSARMNCQSGNS